MAEQKGPADITVPNAPIERPLDVTALFFWFVLGAVLLVFTATALGALALALAGEDLEGLFGLGVAAAAALVATLVLPSLIALTFHAHAVSATRIFAGWNFVIALALIAFLPSATGKALRAHGDWAFQLFGTASPLWSEGMNVVASLLSDEPPEDPAPVAPSATADAGPAAASDEDKPLSAKDVFAKTRDSVVFIGVRKEIDPESFEAVIAKMFGLKELEGHGSGFVVSDDGLIVTNHHVIGEAGSAFVRFADGSRVDDVEVLVKDPSNDLALVRVKKDGLAPLAVFEGDEVSVGSNAFAIGSPLGLDFTLTSGIVSARREQQETSFLQMQTTIAPGSSGGPVLDDRGRLIGVSTATRGAGLNLAVHARHVRDLLQREHAPAALAHWRPSLELQEMEMDGVDALPTVRAQLESTAKVLANGVDGCVTVAPKDGAHVELRLPKGFVGRPKVTSNLDKKARGCVERSTRLVGMQLASVMNKGGSDGATLRCVFKSPDELRDGGTVLGKRVELAIFAGEPKPAPDKATEGLDGGPAIEKKAKKKRRPKKKRRRTRARKKSP